MNHQDVAEKPQFSTTESSKPPNIDAKSKGHDSSTESDTGSLAQSKTEGDVEAPPAYSPLKYEEHPWYLRVPFVSRQSDPPPASLDDAPITPEVTAGWFSTLTMGWMYPVLATGYARPLEATDLWKIDAERSAGVYSHKIDESFARRVQEAEEYNARLDNGEIKAPLSKRIAWTLKRTRATQEKEWREKEGRKKASLVRALNDSVKFWFWSGMALKIIADVAQLMSPLLVKELIKFGSASYLSAQGYSQIHKPPVGKGVGLSIGLYLLMVISSLAMNQAMYRLMSSGVYIRAGLISSIFGHSLKLTYKARTNISNGKLIAHISTDVSRIDFAMGFSMGFTAPIQIIICLILLIINLGWPALVGFGTFVLILPVQGMAVRKMFDLRKSSMVWTDKRSKLLQELLGGMRVIKYFAWEVPFSQRIANFRNRETGFVRTLLFLRSGLISVAFTLPVFAAVLSFITYSLVGNDLDPAIIFTALTYFQLLRMPLMLLPVAISSATDAVNAVGRIQTLFEAEVLTEAKNTDPNLPAAIRVESASFSWDCAPPEEVNTAGMSAKEKKVVKKEVAAAKKLLKAKTSPAAPGASGSSDGDATPPVKEEEMIFKLHDIDLEIPRGQLVAIVGAVGSGKTSLLQGLIGEMRKTAGTITFGGPVAYCPQSAWIQSCSIRDNILFGKPFEEDRYWSVVRDAQLEADLDMLPARDLTEVGERGISLSGGQKQRINIARALYCSPGTVATLFDDPFSALDAHVGKAVFQDVLQTALSGTTRVLVTHALHFLPFCDYIITMDGSSGTIGERGTYADLIRRDGAFSRFVKEYGGQQEEEEVKEEEEAAIEAAGKDGKGKDKQKLAQKSLVAAQQQMQTEERHTGAIKGGVYREYFRAGKGQIWLPVLLFSVLFMQGANIMNSYWLVYWQEKKWHQPQGFYMGIYAGLGAAQAVGMFLMGSVFAIMNFYAARKLHGASIHRIMHAPMSFFDTTPLGRIMNRFTKDIDTLDNTLTDSMRMAVATLAQIVSVIVLIAVILPFFLIPMAVIMLFYFWGAIFYRSSARELKRLDALLRSSLYSHYAESLSGLATIRAYGDTDRFLRENQDRTDNENRAYLLTVVNQRWLGLRLDFLGSSLTFFVAILAVASRTTISPSQTGVILSYMLQVQMSFGWFVRQIAEVENDMNAIERLLHYANEIEQEAPYQKDEPKLPKNWPAAGELVLKNAFMSYRPGLPTVLKGISMHVQPGEHIGIVGRTGAGKSSIMVALYRLSELSSGSIELDGLDVSTLGLDDLRKNIAIIPQDPLLFSGTMRSNLDPFGQYDDAMLWSAMKRAYLVEDETRPRPTAGDETAFASRFTLDTVIEEEGSNLSVGQRSLVSLARAIVVPHAVTLLDEATASVDYGTDQLIQETIASQFQGRTLLCIAHRLRTIIGYDRVCVMDAGKIAEFDTPMNLYHNADGIFRSMCDRSNLSEKDIRIAQTGNPRS